MIVILKEHCALQNVSSVKIITPVESKKIIKGLQRILREWRRPFEFFESLEDIHMNIENRLSEIVGPVAGKLHTARSRNDQVCLDIRLYLRKEIDDIVSELDRLSKALVDIAKKNIDLCIPGYTHFNEHNPYYFPSFLAYVEMMLRDKERFLDAYKRINFYAAGFRSFSWYQLSD
ncbi:MAG: hypothetical protein CM1200mP16_16440 [Nitrospina sp.]|nr:MAG: hypothetical protein CM1200mP16_16440 [Nitrospina sp.]